MVHTPVTIFILAPSQVWSQQSLGNKSESNWQNSGMSEERVGAFECSVFTHWTWHIREKDLIIPHNYIILGFFSLLSWKAQLPAIRKVGWSSGSLQPAAASWHNPHGWEPVVGMSSYSAGTMNSERDLGTDIWGDPGGGLRRTLTAREPFVPEQKPKTFGWKGSKVTQLKCACSIFFKMK